ncbi:hypothetical protein BJ508DRAFT_315676, partial [Ascobolus immersus RN42]
MPKLRLSDVIDWEGTDRRNKADIYAALQAPDEPPDSENDDDEGEEEAGGLASDADENGNLLDFVVDDTTFSEQEEERGRPRRSKRKKKKPGDRSKRHDSPKDLAADAADTSKITTSKGHHPTPSPTSEIRVGSVSSPTATKTSTDSYHTNGRKQKIPKKGASPDPLDAKARSVAAKKAAAAHNQQSFRDNTPPQTHRNASKYADDTPAPTGQKRTGAPAESSDDEPPTRQHERKRNRPKRVRRTGGENKDDERAHGRTEERQNSGTPEVDEEKVQKIMAIQEAKMAELRRRFEVNPQVLFRKRLKGRFNTQPKDPYAVERDPVRQACGAKNRPDVYKINGIIKRACLTHGVSVYKSWMFQDPATLRLVLDDVLRKSQRYFPAWNAGLARAKIQQYLRDTGKNYRRKMRVGTGRVQKRERTFAAPRKIRYCRADETMIREHLKKKAQRQLREEKKKKYAESQARKQRRPDESERAGGSNKKKERQNARASVPDDDEEDNQASDIGLRASAPVQHQTSPVRQRIFSSPQATPSPPTIPNVPSPPSSPPPIRKRLRQKKTTGSAPVVEKISGSSSRGQEAATPGMAGKSDSAVISSKKASATGASGTKSSSRMPASTPNITTLGTNSEAQTPRPQLSQNVSRSSLKPNQTYESSKTNREMAPPMKPVESSIRQSNARTIKVPPVVRVPPAALFIEFVKSDEDFTTVSSFVLTLFKKHTLRTFILAIEENIEQRVKPAEEFFMFCPIDELVQQRDVLWRIVRDLRDIVRMFTDYRRSDGVYMTKISMDDYRKTYMQGTSFAELGFYSYWRAIKAEGRTSTKLWGGGQYTGEELDQATFIQVFDDDDDIPSRSTFVFDKTGGAVEQVVRNYEWQLKADLAEDSDDEGNDIEAVMETERRAIRIDSSVVPRLSTQIRSGSLRATPLPGSIRLSSRARSIHPSRNDSSQTIQPSLSSAHHSQKMPSHDEVLKELGAKPRTVIYRSSSGSRGVNDLGSDVRGRPDSGLVQSRQHFGRSEYSSGNLLTGSQSSRNIRQIPASSLRTVTEMRAMGKSEAEIYENMKVPVLSGFEDAYSSPGPTWDQIPQPQTSSRPMAPAPVLSHARVDIQHGTPSRHPLGSKQPSDLNSRLSHRTSLNSQKSQHHVHPSGNWSQAPGSADLEFRRFFNGPTQPSQNDPVNNTQGSYRSSRRAERPPATDGYGIDLSYNGGAIPGGIDEYGFPNDDAEFEQIPPQYCSGGRRDNSQSLVINLSLTPGASGNKRRRMPLDGHSDSPLYLQEPLFANNQHRTHQRQAISEIPPTPTPPRLAPVDAGYPSSRGNANRQPIMSQRPIVNEIPPTPTPPPVARPAAAQPSSRGRSTRKLMTPGEIAEAQRSEKTPVPIAAVAQSRSNNQQHLGTSTAHDLSHAHQDHHAPGGRQLPPAMK